MDIVGDPVTSANDRKQKKSKESTEEICSEYFLQKNCKDMLNLKLKFIGNLEYNVVLGRCFKHGKKSRIVYKGLDTNTGKLVAVIKWSLPLCNNNLAYNKSKVSQKSKANYLKLIQSIEREFKNLNSLDFNHLVRYLGMQHIVKKDEIIVFVLQEFVCGNSLQVFQELPVTITRLQHYAKQILEALHFLHKNSFVHQNLRLSSIFIDNSGSVKLADYYLEKKLYDLSKLLTKREDINFCQTASEKYTTKEDIYHFGVLILTLFIGPLKKKLPAVIPNDVNPMLKDFLNKCLSHDELNRWSAEQLLSHPFLFHHFSDLDLLRDIETKQDYLESSLRCNVNSSRLTTEFNILKSLGKGGFGQVWKVQNKLDSRMYALKRIPLNPHNRQLNHKIKQEVKLLSRLSHENVIRYYNSWIEAVSDLQQNIQDMKVFGSDKSRILNEDGCDQSYSSVCWDIHNEHFSSDDEDYDNNNDSVIFLRENEHNSKIPDTSDIDENYTQIVQSLNLNEVPTFRMKHYMYIQMEFCENSTLRTAIDIGLHKDAPRLWRLFKEIVEGLHYIHQQGVIHRDLKPVNIFLDSNDHVKIGDFGLATDTISKPAASETTIVEIENESYLNARYVSQTGEIGTAYYVAPELACSEKVHYNQKVDIYSLGIIFFEMCFPPPVTFMERNIILTDLRKKDIVLPDKAYEVLNDDMIHIIIWLLQHDATKRPSSVELITSKYVSSLSMTESEYYCHYSIAITAGGTDLKKFIKM